MDQVRSQPQGSLHSTSRYQGESKRLFLKCSTSVPNCARPSPLITFPFAGRGSYHNSSSNSLTFSRPTTHSVSMTVSFDPKRCRTALQEDILLTSFPSKLFPFLPSPLVKQMLIIHPAGLTTSQMRTISRLLHFSLPPHS